MTGESVRPFGVQADRSGRARAFLRCKSKIWGCKQSGVSTICKSWSYKPLAFQRFRLRGRAGQTAKRLGTVVKSARCSSALKGRSDAPVVWQARSSDEPKRDRPALGGAIDTNALVGIGNQETQRPAICASGDCPMALTIGSQPSSRRGLGAGVPVGAVVSAGLFTALWLFTGTRGIRGALWVRVALVCCFAAS